MEAGRKRASPRKVIRKRKSSPRKTSRKVSKRASPRKTTRNVVRKRASPRVASTGVSSYNQSQNVQNVSRILKEMNQGRVLEKEPYYVDSEGFPYQKQK